MGQIPRSIEHISSFSMQLMHNLQIQVGELYRLKIGGGERHSPAFPLTLTTGSNDIIPANVHI